MKIGKYVTIDPTAIVSDDCDVDDYVAIRARSKIGRGVVLKCRATIGHDCSVGDGCFVGAHAILLNGGQGASHIGNRVYLGACACVLPQVTVCSDVVIGAGAVITKNITIPGTYVGNPCKLIHRSANFPSLKTTLHSESTYISEISCTSDPT